jgi:hypothetical protein
MTVMMETKGMHGRNHYVCVCVFLFLAQIENSIARRKDGWNFMTFLCNMRPWFDEFLSQVSTSLGFCTGLGLVDELRVNPKADGS